MFPTNMVDSSVYEKVSINSIIWKVSPIELDEHEDKGFSLQFISIFLIDAYHDLIPINFKNIFISYPEVQKSIFNEESLGWNSYSLDFEEDTINISEWIIYASNINSGSSCSNWEKLMMTILTNHLSSFASIYELPQISPSK